MSIVMDRLKASFYSLVHAATSRLAYAAPRIARVVSGTTASDGSTTLDLVPEDPSFPSMAGVPLFHGTPGESITLASGTRVVVEFSEADPARPFVRSWAGGESVAVRTLTAQTLNLGGLGAQPTILGVTYRVAEGEMDATMLAALAAFNAVSAVIDPVEYAAFILLYPTIGATITALKTFLPLWLAALQAFEAQTATYLARNAKVL